MITCYKASYIISGDEMQVIKDSCINVLDGRILSIGLPVSEAKVIDLGHVLLSPLFIDAHCHLGDTGAKELGVGLPLEQVVVPPNGLKHRFLADLDPETHIHQMHHGLTEMLANGIIACADFREQGLMGVQALREATQDLPIRVFVLGRMSENNASMDEIYQEARAILEKADGLGIRDISAYPQSLLQTLREEYPEKIFAIHVSESYEAEIKSRSEFGLGQTARALAINPDLLVHLTHTPLNELEMVANHQVYAVCCPRANGILGDGLPDVSTWIKAGVSVVIGSDNMMISSPDMFREMDYLSRMQRGYHHDTAIIETREIFKAATIYGARALKIDQDLGSIAPGKEANFLVIDLKNKNLLFVHDYLSAMVHRTNITDICNIYIKGEKYV